MNTSILKKNSGPEVQMFFVLSWGPPTLVGESMKSLFCNSSGMLAELVFCNSSIILSMGGELLRFIGKK